MLNQLRRLYNWFTRDPIIIHLYYTFKYKDKVYLRGRILQNRLVISKPSDRALKSLIKFVRRLLTYEQKFKSFIVLREDIVHPAVTDKEGYFEVTLPCPQGYKDLIRIRTDHAEDVAVVVEEISQDVSHGIISDIDDTILRTGVASKFKWRLLMNTIFINPWRRESFNEAQEVFQSLTRYNDSISNPIFYISNSPWNIYNYIYDFLTQSRFPKGPLLLRDFSISWFSSKELHERNKFIEICKVLDICSDLSFILIGDSGELDADIYNAINLKYPERIRAIYIRKIPKSKRLPEIQLIINKMKGKGLLFQENHELLEHATSRGFLDSV